MAERKETQVARWDPFADLGLLQRWRPFGEFGDSPSRLSRMMEEAFGEARPSLMAPKVDITESDDQYAVAAELPGVKKDDLTLEIQEGVLTIRGEKKEERDEKRDKGRRLERYYGAFSRSFSLPSDADADKVEASFKDGVLTVALPKKPEAKPAQVAIKG